MADTNYPYLITDFLNDLVDSVTLTDEINSSSIASATLRWIDTDLTAGTCDIWFDGTLSAGDITTLNGLVAAHTGALPDATTAARGAARAPTTTDDITVGVLKGDTWLDTLGNKCYVCVDNASGAAVWQSTVYYLATTSSTAGLAPGFVGTTDRGKFLHINASADTLEWVTVSVATHASTHVTGGGDTIALATVGSVAGLLPGFVATTDRGKYLRINASADTLEWATISGTGDVVGPSSATDNALVRFNLTTGKLVQDSTATLGDNGDLTLTSGAAATVPLTVKAHASQSGHLQDWTNSSSTPLVYIDSSGNIAFSSTQTVDGVDVSAHASRHVTGGGDTIALATVGSVAGLLLGFVATTDRGKYLHIASGADTLEWVSQPAPLSHASTHVTGGGDTIALATTSSTAGLAPGFIATTDRGKFLIVNTSADTLAWSAMSTTLHGQLATAASLHALAGTTNSGFAPNFTATTDRGKYLHINASADTLEWIAQPAPLAHASTHVTGGGDTIATATVASVAGLLIGFVATTDRNKYLHINSGADTLEWVAQSAPLAHASTHVTGGGDTIALATVASVAGLAPGFVATTDRNKFLVVSAADALTYSAMTTTLHGQLGTAASLHALADTTNSGFIPSFVATTDRNKYLHINASADTLEWATVTGTGDVVGPSSATDNAICRFDLTTGKLIQNSSATIDDNGNVYLNADGSSTAVPRILGATGFSSGEAIRWEFGDTQNAIQNSYGGSMTVRAYHTIVLRGGHNGAAVAWDTESSIGTLIDNTVIGSQAFVVRGASGQTAALQQWRNSSNAVLASVDASGNVLIGPSVTLITNNPLAVEASVDAWVQTNVQNKSAGTAASGDTVVTADNGSDSTYYVDLGINSSTYNQAAYNIGAANDSYLYCIGGHLCVGTGTAAKTIKFHTGGSTTTQLRATISDVGITLAAQGDVRFGDSDSSQYVGFKAPATVATSLVWTLPAADGTSGQVLSTNASAVLSWASRVSGPGTVVDNQIVRFDSTTGNIIQAGTGAPTYDDSGHITLNTATIGSDINGFRQATFKRLLAQSGSGGITIDWTAGAKQKVTMTGSQTITFGTNPTGPCNLMLEVVQDATGNRVAGWAVTTGSLYAPGGKTTGLVLSTAASAIDVIGIFFDGTNYFAAISKAFAT